MPASSPTNIRTAPTTIATMAVLLVCAVAVIIGLATRPSGGLSVPRGSHVVHVDEGDFHIDLHGATSLASGNYVFVDTNHGPNAHELVIWKTAIADDKLPLSRDQRVNEDSDALEGVLDSGTSLQPGETRLLGVSLFPGHYVIVCNLSGHYHAGMHAEFTVH